MSTRQQRRDWQEFREEHGATPTEFRKKWRAMFDRMPNEEETRQYIDKRAELRTPLGRKKAVPRQQVTVTKRYEWDMGHRLPDHDGKCRNLHGHRYVAEIDITGPVHRTGAQAGMVVDFYHIKKLLDDVIGGEWDHKLMLFKDDPIAVALKDQMGWGIIRVHFVPTAENIAVEILRLMKRNGLKATRVRVYETPSGWAEVRA